MRWYTSILILACCAWNALLAMDPTDSLILNAAMTGDQVTWELALDTSATQGVWAPFKGGVVSDWLPQNDTVRWLFAQWVAPTLAYSLSDGPQEVVRLAPPTASTLLFWPAWIVGGMVAWTLLLFVMRFSRWAPTSLPPDLKPVDAFLRNKEIEMDAARAAWHHWQRKIGLSETADFKVLFADLDLTPTEIEVAECILLGLNAQEIAAQLQCTPSYIYNVRSSVRKKLDLDPESPIERQLKAFVDLQGERK